MLERACHDLSAWRRDMPDLARELTMSVNLSAQEVHSERLVPVVTEVEQPLRLFGEVTLASH